jgi:hypothetical protein
MAHSSSAECNFLGPSWSKPREWMQTSKASQHSCCFTKSISLFCSSMATGQHLHDGICSDSWHQVVSQVIKGYIWWWTRTSSSEPTVHASPYSHSHWTKEIARYYKSCLYNTALHALHTSLPQPFQISSIYQHTTDSLTFLDLLQLRACLEHGRNSVSAW